MNLAPKDFIRAAQRDWTLAESLEYTRWMATSHYENFNVVSFLLPKKLHQDFYNVYAYCRWADDLGDEIGNTEESLELLGWWRNSLVEMYRGEASHPVFIALRGTVEAHHIPIDPFQDLITAFIQDQTVTRYEDWSGLVAYCKNSANPVGRLILYLCGYSDAKRQALSDQTCTGLQLANFWQDVTVDLDKDRIYLPKDLLTRHNYSVEDLFNRRMKPGFPAAMREAVEYARGYFRAGLPLIGMVDKRLALDLELFSRGGMKILDKIEQQGFDVLTKRPKISKPERVTMLMGAMLSVAFRRAA